MMEAAPSKWTAEKNTEKKKSERNNIQPEQFCHLYYVIVL